MDHLLLDADELKDLKVSDVACVGVTKLKDISSLWNDGQLRESETKLALLCRTVKDAKVKGFTFESNNPERITILSHPRLYSPRTTIGSVRWFPPLGYQLESVSPERQYETYFWLAANAINFTSDVGVDSP